MIAVNLRLYYRLTDNMLPGIKSVQLPVEWPVMGVWTDEQLGNYLIELSKLAVPFIRTELTQVAKLVMKETVLAERIMLALDPANQVRSSSGWNVLNGVVSGDWPVKYKGSTFTVRIELRPYLIQEV